MAKQAARGGAAERDTPDDEANSRLSGPKVDHERGVA
jgi:hypothetical protein